MENVSMSYSDAPKRSVPDKAPFIFYEGGEEWKSSYEKPKTDALCMGSAFFLLYAP
ncbi:MULTISPECIES: hypothetical protein [Desulfovibrio]|uniref:hypothetical protein n=1 Tax=Desulfovibrio TaxID=872 RepID=UPI0012FD6CAB|nr:MULTISPECIES: hypothetical protein [Desulfovibrio]